MGKLIGSLLLLTAVLGLKQVNAQEIGSNITKTNKGQFYFYWGWNQSVYSRSNIHFTGVDYSFRLDGVKAKDRQSALSWDYINPMKMTIPQYNFRVGYYFNDNWSISLGNDHMKYVMSNGQRVEISGHIGSTETAFNADYDHAEIELTEEFLRFEHTDGLNYENIELRHISTVHRSKSFDLNVVEGIGAGILLPKTNSTLLGNERNDEFHLAGYGTAAVLAFQALHKGGFFMQMEMKGGFINMPDILTTKYKEDRGRQNFFFFQYNFVLGYQFTLVKSKKD